jgi:hypothetical protein
MKSASENRAHGDGMAAFRFHPLSLTADGAG